ncbi:hypothetical protein SteCoe_13733 [Stentor coeruleus]|uniref:DOMON domain-containing protein n=1 Tax=Stentor coeruleus TaxID=5963 RepID=A0A1R2C7L6_9CILI|nr:hypothetical protein SteCoe_13733 [Stentor coeruleus]
MVFKILTFLSIFIMTSGVFLEFSIVSDESSWVYVASTLSEGNAAIYTTQGGWATKLLDASWIGGKNAMNVAGNSTITKFFYIAGIPESGKLSVGADDYFTTYINDKTTNCRIDSGSFTLSAGRLCDVFSYLVNGLNKIVFEVKNGGGPGGLMFRLVVTSNL